MAKADDLMPKFSMTTVTPHKVIASLMQVNNPWDPDVGSYYPSVFKDTRVFPLYKKGDPLEAKAWRPISITNALYRIVFKLMYQQLYEHLEPQLHPLQFGARKNRSCAQTTLVMEGMVDFFRKNHPQQNVFLGLLDIKNAFTSVPIHLLMRVMEKRGVPIEWLSMVFEASYNVKNSLYNPITKEYDEDVALFGSEARVSLVSALLLHFH